MASQEPTKAVEENDATVPEPPKEPRPNPLDEKCVALNPFNRYFFHYLNRIFDVGYKRILQASDMFLLPSNQKPKLLAAQFDKAVRDQGENRHWLRAVIKVSWVQWFVMPFIYKAFFLAAFGLQPALLKGILQFMEEPELPTLWNLPGWGIATLLAVDTFVIALFMQMGWGELARAATIHRTLVQQWVMEKALRLTAGSREFVSTGQIVTLMAVDADRIAMGVIFSHWSWLCIGQLAIVIYFMVSELGGYATACAMVVVVIMILFQWGTAGTLRRARAKTTKMTDIRVRLINEIIQGIRVIKAYAWEKAAIKQVEEARSTELSNLRTLLILMGVNYAVMFIAPVFVGLVGFLSLDALIAAGVNITGEDGLPITVNVSTVFTTFAAINLLRLPVKIIPMVLRALIEATISYRRLNRLMHMPELDDPRILNGKKVAELPDGTENADLLVNQAAPTTAIKVSRCRFSWHVDDAKGEDEKGAVDRAFSLHVDSLHIAQGELVCVAGVVGSGKSSLLNALLGELVPIRTTNETVFDVCGARSYVAQTAWIQNLSMQNVITFGNRFDQTIYDRVVTCCQLRPDIAILPDGDQTEIGERGINLSGGQKQRVAIARAVYHKCIQQAAQLGDEEAADEGRSETSIFLLDDPLSAVDLHVASALFDEVIANKEMMGDKTRVLVLNSHYHLMRRADRVIVMADGKVAAVGTYAELESNSSLFKSMIQTREAEDVEQQDASVDTASSTSAKPAVSSATDSTPAKDEGGDDVPLPHPAVEAAPRPEASEEDQDGVLVASNSTNTEAITVAQEPEKDDAKPEGDTGDAASEEDDAPSKLIQAEEKSEGAVTCRTYVAYFQSATMKMGLCVFITVVLSFAVAQTARTLDDWFLAEWANGTAPLYESLYGGFAGVTFALYIISSISFMVVAVAASKNFHNHVFAAVLAAPINLFYDVTPVGRILNRFGKDIDQIDILVPDYLIQFLQNSAFFVSAIVMCIIATPWMGLGLIPLIIIFLFLGSFFRRSIREMKRIEAVSRSPVYSSFTEALNGVSTIRAFKKSRIFIDAHAAKVDFTNGVWMTNWLAGCWFGERVDTIGAFIVLGVGLIATLVNDPDTTALVGLALTFTLQFMSLLQWTVRVFIETETNMIAVERLNHYVINVPAEQSTTIDMPEEQLSTVVEPGASNSTELVELGAAGSKRTPAWPVEGTVSFENFVMSYRPGLPTVLRGITLHIRGQEKVGVCGRTGAGKSSLIVALLRICEGSSGRILIDGLDIRGVPLRKLRSHITLIPQEPFLFSTDIRRNLDPFDEHSDEEVWDVLKAVSLESQVREFEGQLQHKLTDNGGNLSQGTRQLICMGRALLRHSKIIIMDEATASVDSSTDNAIQRMIVSNFSYATVLTIAHRINTIMNSDRVAVLDQGVVVEYDSPTALLQKGDGHFASLVSQMNADESQSH